MDIEEFVTIMRRETFVWYMGLRKQRKFGDMHNRIGHQIDVARQAIDQAVLDRAETVRAERAAQDEKSNVP